MPNQPVVSIAAADVLTGYYKRARMSQSELAEASGIPATSLQKKLKGNAPITAHDLVVLSDAIGVDPATVMSEIMREVEKHEAADVPVSEVPVSLDDHRKRRTPADMDEEEWGGLSSAANTDPEIGLDEPEDT